MGRPKALVTGPDGVPWLARGVAVLRDAGCDPVFVVLGARADEARPLVPEGVGIMVADDWAEGMGASLRAGLRHLVGEGADESGALVTLVDLPDLTGAVARRVREGTTEDSLARATFDGRPGHPVFLGRAHWPGLIDSLAGDEGARGYLAAHDVVEVECGDLATGRDQDTPA